jgi:hypothetical protein
MMAHVSQHTSAAADHKDSFLATPQSHPADLSESYPSSINDTAEASPDADAEQRVRESIAAAASQNADLLAERSSTDHAPVQYADAQKRTEFLEERLKAQKTEVYLHATAADVQLKRHKAFRDSFTKKLTYTVLRKKEDFVEKAKKEEDAYHDALGKRHKSEAQLAELEANKSTLQEETRTLEALLNRHGAAHVTLDSLYSSIFDGPTAGFPDEDSQEERYKRAKIQHDARTDDLKAVTRGVRAVTAIKTAIERAKAQHHQAETEALSIISSYSYLDSVFTQCATYASKGLDLSRIAVQDIPPSMLDSRVTQAKIALDQTLRSVVELGSDRRWSRGGGPEVAASTIGGALRTAFKQQVVYLAAIKTSSEAARQAIRGTARTLEDERQGLQQLRQGAFETTVGFGAAAPAYRECCDRAGWFEGESDAQCVDIAEPVVEELPPVPPPEYVYEAPERDAQRDEPSSGRI